jgi:hypothetical protein
MHTYEYIYTYVNSPPQLGPNTKTYIHTHNKIHRNIFTKMWFLMFDITNSKIMICQLYTSSQDMDSYINCNVK